MMKVIGAIAMWVASLILLGFLAKLAWMIASLGWNLI